MCILFVHIVKFYYKARCKNTKTSNILVAQYILYNRFPSSWQEEVPEGFPTNPDQRENEYSIFTIVGLCGH